MNNLKIKVPIWFWAIAIIFLLWNIMGVLSFLMHTLTPGEALSLMPLEERELYDSYPAWATVLFAIGVFCGLIGSLGLLFRKKWAKPIFTLSLIAVIIQMTHNVFFTNTVEVYGTTQAVTIPLIVVVLSLLAVLFSNSTIKKNWLQ